MITFTLSTFNTLNYLKLAIESVRKNSYYKHAPFVIHAENCTDGTDEWLLENKDKYIGKKCEVRFFEYSEYGVPRHPVMHGFRDDK